MLTIYRPDDTQVCSCHNVTKGEISKVIKDGTCKSMGEVKSCTKAGMGCAGCIPLVQTIFNAEMKALGNEIKNYCKFWCEPSGLRGQLMSDSMPTL